MKLLFENHVNFMTLNKSEKRFSFVLFLIPKTGQLNTGNVRKLDFLVLVFGSSLGKSGLGFISMYQSE